MRPGVLPMFSDAVVLAPVAVEKARQASNRDKVLAYLQQHGSATNVELVKHVGGLRAMGRVNELVLAGYPITVQRVQGGLWRVTLKGAKP